MCTNNFFSIFCICLLVLLCSDELTQTCERLQDELSKSSIEIDRLNSNLLKTEDENRAHTEEIKALKDQMNTVYTKVYTLEVLCLIFLSVY